MFLQAFKKTIYSAWGLQIAEFIEHSVEKKNRFSELKTVKKCVSC